MTKPASTMTGGSALVAALDAWGVEVVFGIPGVHTLAVYDALYEHPRIRHITARHEGGAGFMADGFARATGKVGVVLTTTGPAAVNALTPLAGAYAESSPLLLVASGPSTTVSGESGELHEMRDQFATLLSVCGHGRRVEAVEEVPEAVAEAFTHLRGGRPRPYALEIALDVIDREGEIIVPDPVLAPPLVPSADDLDRAGALLQASSRPLLLGGGGAQDAAKQVRILAERLGAPVGLTINGLGVLPSDHPLCLRVGSVPDFGRCLESADVVVAVGTRFGQLTVGGWPTPPRRLVHIDIDPEVTGRRYPAEVALVGDAARTLDLLIDRLGEGEVKGDWATGELATEGVLPAEDDLNLKLVRAVRAVLNRDAVLTNDMTNVCYRARRAFPVYTPRSFLCPYYSGVLGFAVPEAIGAKVGCPERQVVALCGDGGFLFTAQELAVACQEGLSLPIVVFNDECFKAIEGVQDRSYGGRRIGVRLYNPNLVRYAESFGIPGVRVSSCEALSEALSKALGAEVPTLIEVWVPDLAS